MGNDGAVKQGEDALKENRDVSSLDLSGKNYIVGSFPYTTPVPVTGLLKPLECPNSQAC